jgi:uncharacterized membrane protein
MSTLSVWRFDTPDGADKAVETLGTLSVQQLVTVHDAATVTWPEGAKKPKTREPVDRAGERAARGVRRLITSPPPRRRRRHPPGDG